MVKIQWSLTKGPKALGAALKQRWRISKLTIRSLTYNHFMNWSYACDILLEPIFRFVENFSGVIGPVLVAMSSILTAIVVGIAYYIGFPYWWEKSPTFTIILLIIGNWLLINVLFHYYMGVKTPAGHTPEGGLIPEAVSICKKCIKPKPPRTHHCSICNKCVLKMDHHCPWLNNCVGHYTHRHFLLYMAFTIIGTIFIMIFGAEIAYKEFFPEQEPELDGHPVRINNSIMIPVTEMMDHLSSEELVEIAKLADETKTKEWRRRLILFAGLISVAVFMALGGLAWWHAGLITKGETSIEARINASETIRYQNMGKIYINPYDFGARENWIIFLGLKERSWWYIFFPSMHQPHGNGLTWESIYDRRKAALRAD